MRINVNITYDILKRTSYVHPAFITTDSAIPYALKPLLPGLHCHRAYAGFCDHNGNERGFWLTSEMTEFYDLFLATKEKERQNLKPIKLLLDLPQAIVNYYGEVRMNRVLRSTPQLSFAK